VEEFLLFVLVGFVAQLADGALGMGFGVISSAILLGQGVTPALVSASVNAAKIPTGTVAALSHQANRNTDWPMARRLAVSGIVGGLVGALVLSNLKGDLLNLMIASYLLLIGTLIILRGLRGSAPRVLGTTHLGLIGGAGGLIEGIGGSWGPIVSSALLGAGVNPRNAIGSSAFAELMVSFAVFLTLGATFAGGMWGENTDWSDVGSSVAGLVVGGLPAALIGGHLARRVPKRPLTVAVGILAFGIGVRRMLLQF
jgi:uncharacterized membrane protein YfcA|tara:strand:- start:2520 stop:3284 length:765 start_codon:yes stop_codon:yes gene_type:complete